MPPLYLVIAEAALETVPVELTSHPEVRSHARRMGVDPHSILLDRSYHHRAMIGLREGWKRGRPDIVHLALLEALGTPLNMEGLLKVYVHTINNQVLTIEPQVRLPRNYLRFKGLMEQLFQHGRVPPETSERPLISLKEQSLKELIEELGPSLAIGLSTQGEPETLTSLAGRLVNYEKPTIVVGGFPKGHFEASTTSCLQELRSIDPASLDSWITVSRVVYAFELALKLDVKRIQKIERGTV